MSITMRRTCWDSRPSLRDLRLLGNVFPALPSWAKLGRSCGAGRFLSPRPCTNIDNQVKAIVSKDEKLYRIKARDYGGPVRRVCGIAVHSLAKGIAVATVVSFLFVNSKLSFSGWLLMLMPLVVVFSIWAAVSDRPLYVCELQVQPDRLIRFSGGTSVAIKRAQVRNIREGSRWTLFGPAKVLSIQGKDATIFVPVASPEYQEIKSRLVTWQMTPI